MIKRIVSPLAIIAFLLVHIAAFAQSNTDFDERLLERFSEKEIEKLDKAELAYWSFYLENSIEIVDIPKEKPDAVPAVIKLGSMDMHEINVFKLGLEPHEYARDYFRIEGTNKMIVVLPQSEIDEKFKAIKK